MRVEPPKVIAWDHEQIDPVLNAVMAHDPPFAASRIY
jgi:hypothetical protein